MKEHKQIYQTTTIQSHLVATIPIKSQGHSSNRLQDPKRLAAHKGDEPAMINLK